MAVVTRTTTARLVRGQVVYVPPGLRDDLAPEEEAHLIQLGVATPVAPPAAVDPALAAVLDGTVEEVIPRLDALGLAELRQLAPLDERKSIQKAIQGRIDSLAPDA